MIEDEYVRSGKLQVVFLDLPLQMHAHAFKAAEAAQCAGEQDRFWDYHRKLFKNYRTIRPEALRGWAEELELDLAAFDACLEDGRTTDGIKKDMRVASSLGIRGTPAYLLGRRDPETGEVKVLEKLSGAQPLEVFKAKIDALLKGK